MRLLVMVAVALALVFGGAGYAIHYVKDHAADVVHRAIDTRLPERVQEHPWAPVVHGRPVRRDAIVFGAGASTRSGVTSHWAAMACRSCTASRSLPRRRGSHADALVCCIRKELARATRASDAADGTTTMLTLTEGGDTVLTLRGVHG